MTSKQTTLVVTSTPNMADADAMQEYVRGVVPLLLGLGGTIIKRSKHTDTYLGETCFTFLLIMDFPSKQAVIDMFESDAYKALIPLRDKGFDKIDILFAQDLT